MKISTDQALDMLPAVVDIYEKLELEAFIKDSRKRFKVDPDQEPEDVYIEAVSHLAKTVLRNTPLIKEEVSEVVAIAEGSTVDEVKERHFAKTIKTFMEIFKDEEIMELFKSAM